MSIRGKRFRPPTAAALRKKQEGKVLGVPGNHVSSSIPPAPTALKPLHPIPKIFSGKRALRAGARHAFDLNQGTEGKIKFKG